MRRVLVLLGSALFVACSGAGESVVTNDVQPADDTVDAAADLAPADLPPDVPVVDVSGEDVELVFDVPTDTGVGPACAPGEGCFLDPCTANDQCQSGWCVEHMGGGVCSTLCVEECPPGWSCKAVGSGGPDLTSVCVSGHANLCRPCAAAADCKSVGGAEDVCVDYGAEGSFCGGICAADDDCPWGFSCEQTLTVDGVESKQCVAEAGVCPCTDRSVELALWTPCQRANEWGACAGKRFCTDEGLADCDALLPAAETCNGIDDDCDNLVDEPDEVAGKFVPLCDDANPCTEDICDGEAGCSHEALTAGECSDNDACTAGDHCDEGVCVGSPIVCDDDNPCTDDACDGLGGCLFEPNAGACDDSDPCTVADQCKEGTCVGFAVACDCLSDADCAPLEDGNLCNGTLLCNQDAVPYQCEVDPETVVTCDSVDGLDPLCQAVQCNPATGACDVVADHDGLACDDADPCTVGESCADGACAGGVPANCNDSNPCTDDTCESESGCVHTPNAQPCDDGNPCTLGDGCVEGSCKGAQAVDCDDSNPCTTDLCSPAEGCLHKLNTAPCDDGNACTTGDACQLGECVPGLALTCNDNNPCTNDACKPQAGCTFTPNQAACDDGNPCTTGDSCQNGWCLATPLDCDDANPCTDDACAPATGCVHQANAMPCIAPDFCTLYGTCVEGACVGQGAVNCDDSNPCTDDSCDPATGCVHTPNAQPCDDANPCTVTDMCSAGACVGNGALNCEDGNLCTTDTCDPQSGCVHTANDNPCDDGDACTTNDQCAGGECTPGAPLACSDGNDCTEDSCDPESGCVHPPIVPCCGNGAADAGEDCDGNDDAACPGQCSAKCTCPWVSIHNTVPFSQTAVSNGCSYNGGHAVKWANLGGMSWKSCVVEAAKRGAMLHSSAYTVNQGWNAHRKGSNAMLSQWDDYMQADVTTSHPCIIGRDPHATKNDDPLSQTIEYDGWTWRYQDFGTMYYDQCQTKAGNAGAMIITPYTIGQSGDGYWVNSVHMCNTYEWITGNGANYANDNVGSGQRSSVRKCMIGFVEKIQP